MSEPTPVHNLDDLLRRFDKELWARKASPPEVQYLARQWKLPQPDYQQITDAAKRVCRWYMTGRTLDFKVRPDAAPITARKAQPIIGDCLSSDQWYKINGMIRRLQSEGVIEQDLDSVYTVTEMLLECGVRTNETATETMLSSLGINLPRRR